MSDEEIHITGKSGAKVADPTKLIPFNIDRIKEILKSVKRNLEEDVDSLQPFSRCIPHDNYSREDKICTIFKPMEKKYISHIPTLNKEKIDAIFNPSTRYSEQRGKMSENVDNKMMFSEELQSPIQIPPCVVCSKRKSKSLTKKLKERSPSVGLTQINSLSPLDSMESLTQPFIYFRLIARFPVLAFLSTLSIQVIVLLVTLVLLLMEYDLFPAHFENLPLILQHDSTRKYDLAWRDKNIYPNYVHRWVTGSYPPSWKRGRVGDVLELIYESNNILTQSGLKVVSEFEDGIVNMKEYKEKYCRLTGKFQCEKPSSLLRLFDGTYAHIDRVFVDSGFENIPQVLSKGLFYNETREFTKLFLGKTNSIGENSAMSPITRSFILLGWPVYYKDNLENFIQNGFKDTVKNMISSLSSDSISIYYISNLMFQHDVFEQAVTDMKLAIGSFIFIYVFMTIQTSSIWISTWGIFSVISSFLLTNLIYRCIFGYIYFGFFHIIAIFIILGIGADDLFVFHDTWRLTGGKKWPSLAHRLSECYLRATKTTFVTSLTTAVAFLVSGLSPLLAVSTFGIFSGVLILVNYISAIVFFPTVIAMHGYLKACTNERYPCLKKTLDCQCRSSDDTDTNDNDKSFETDTLQPFSERNRIVKFLKNGYFSLIRMRAIRITVPVIFFVTSLYFIYAATLLVPDSQQVKIFRDDTNYGKGFMKHNSAFWLNMEYDYTRVYLVWGINGKDFSGCNTKSYKYCIGESVFDPDFYVSSPEAQIAMLNLCHRLESLTDAEVDDMKIKRDVITGKPEISCFMTAFERFLKKEEEVCTGYGYSVDLSLPLTREKVKPLLDIYPSIFTEPLGEDFDHWFEVMLTFWLVNHYSFSPTEDYFHYNNLIGTQNVEGTTKQAFHNMSEIYYGTILRYMAVEINTTLNLYSTGFPEGKPVYDRWESFLQEEMKKMPESMKDGFQTTKNLWHWLKVQESLADSAVMGIVVSLCLALPILIIMTRNFVIGFLATITISLVTICVIGIIPLAGWRLGVLESLNLCMVVGLSVDYVVHLAEAYSMSPAYGRLQRVQDMLESMGLSVLSGAVTSFGAALFMIFAQIQFLYQFGIFVLCTIGLSFLYSILGFTTFLALCGPQGDTGSMLVVWRSVNKGTRFVWKKISSHAACIFSFSATNKPSHSLDTKVVIDHSSLNSNSDA